MATLRLDTPPVTGPTLGRAGRPLGLVVLAVLLAGVAVASLALGSLEIPLREVVAAFTDRRDTDAHVIVAEVRLPRTILGLLVGASLGAAGALMQGVSRNPLAEPGILGINSGAAFAVVLAIFLLGIDEPGAYAGFALVGAAGTALLVAALGTSGRGGATPMRLALAGAVLGSLFVALTSAVLVFDADTLDQFRFWIVGSIAGRDSGVIVAVLPFLLVGLAIALVSGRRLNALALGDDVARALGHHLGRTRLLCAAGFVLLAGGSVAAAGPIAFLGLMVPHLARAVVGADYRWVVPYSMVLGAIVLLAADVAGRLMSRPAELEVGVVIALVGAPTFIWIVRRGRLASV